MDAYEEHLKNLFAVIYDHNEWVINEEAAKKSYKAMDLSEAEGQEQWEKMLEHKKVLARRRNQEVDTNSTISMDMWRDFYINDEDVKTTKLRKILINLNDKKDEIEESKKSSWIPFLG